MKVFSLFAVLIASLYSISFVAAHHGWRGYSVDFEMSATVVEVKFGNPHDQISVQDADGERWDFLLAPPARNRRFGYDESVVAIGDTVELVGQHSESINEGKVHLIKNTAGETIYTYYYDSGQTSLERARR